MTKQYLIPLLVLLISNSSMSYADDSEVYFTNQTLAEKPNILFLANTGWTMKDPISSTETMSKMDAVRNTINSILQQPATKNVHIGLVVTGDSTSRTRVIVNAGDLNSVIDESNATSQVFNTTTNSITIQTLRKLGGFSITEEPNDLVPTYSDLLRTKKGTVNTTRYINIPIKAPGSVGINSSDKGIRKAYLQYKATDYLNVRPDPTINYTVNETANIYDNTDQDKKFMAITSSPIFRPIEELKKISGSPITCTMRPTILNSERFCDVTELIRKKISQPGWSNGNTITIFQKIEGTSDDNIGMQFGDFSLVIEADPKLIAENKMTTEELLYQFNNQVSLTGSPNLNESLIILSQYTSNIPQLSGQTKGPFKPYDSMAPSPLLNSCQTTNAILLSDGRTIEGLSYTSLREYVNQTTAAQCRAYLSDRGYNNIDYDRLPYAISACTLATAAMLATVNHGTYEGPNYIHTYTVAFGSQITENHKYYLEALAKVGLGKFYDVDNQENLTGAFTDIINSAITINNFIVSSQTVSSRSPYRQRDETFYTFFTPQSYNYWPGNMKGFFIKYVKTVLTDGSEGQRAVLYDKTWSPAMDSNGTIANSASSFWSNADGSEIHKGGVLNALPNDPAQRNIFTIKSGGHTTLEPKNISNVELDLTSESNTEEIRAGLLKFINGYSYQLGGSSVPATKKIGDSGRGAVQLATYGCTDIDKQDILSCPFDKLDQIALLAGNDGFIRGYNVNNGKALYEYMPHEMLPIIKKLQDQPVISSTRPKFYGLDGSIMIYHEDTNKDSYINHGEKAYAYAVSGRGGSYIYAIDISEKNNPKLAWSISNDSFGFSKLGQTWSVPVVGKININNTITPVLIFGGGYDTLQNDHPEKKADNVGNAVYIVNATTGKLIWSSSDYMLYSVPGSVTVLTDSSSNHLITDFFFGDMGGQLWRFQINNGSADKPLAVPAGGNHGIIASIAGSDKANARRFYQTPLIYTVVDKKNNYTALSVNIGSGYKAHPLTTETQDRFYSFRFPVKANPLDTTVLTENDLALTADDGQSVVNSGKLGNGFMIKLNDKGEKFISNAYVDFNRVVFNSYTPSTTMNYKTCTPGSSTERTYNYNLLTGVSLLHTPYIENSIMGLPNDVTSYCNGTYCSIISNPSQLSENTELPTGKDGVDPFVVRICGGEFEDCVIKTSWTDLFSPVSL